MVLTFRKIQIIWKLSHIKHCGFAALLWNIFSLFIMLKINKKGEYFLEKILKIQFSEHTFPFGGIFHYENNHSAVSCKSNKSGFLKKKKIWWKGSIRKYCGWRHWGRVDREILRSESFVFCWSEEELQWGAALIHRGAWSKNSNLTQIDF